MKRSIFILILLFLFSCGKTSDKNILSEEKMVAILTDMQLADAASRERLLPEDYLKDPKRWYLDIMQAHQTDTATFSASLRFYVQDPEKLSKIYDEVNNNLMKEIGTPLPPKK